MSATSPTRHIVHRAGACAAVLLAFSSCSSFGHGAPRDATARIVDTRFPVVLVHGIAGFPWGSGIPYFKGLDEALRARGDTVVTAALPPYDDDPVRAAHLARTIDEVLSATGASKVHILAHSQGGLDARHLVERTPDAARVATLTTLSTPHHGTPIADLAHHMLPDVVLDVTLGVHGLFIGSPSDVVFETPDGSAAVAALTSSTRDARNRDAPTTEVPIFSFAGVTGEGGEETCARGAWGALRPRSAPQLGLVPTWTMMLVAGRERPIANDGLVPVESAVYGTFLGCLPADHMELMGHGGLAFRGESTVELDFVAFFVDYVERLHALEETGNYRELVSLRPARLPTKARDDVRFSHALESSGGSH